MTIPIKSCYVEAIGTTGRFHVCVVSREGRRYRHDTGNTPPDYEEAEALALARSVRRRGRITPVYWRLIDGTPVDQDDNWVSNFLSV
jgi:hypothetical protein